jgi:hypothetical protein
LLDHGKTPLKRIQLNLKIFNKKCWVLMWFLMRFAASLAHYSMRQVNSMLAQLCWGLPSSVPGLNWHFDKPALAASSKRLKPEDFSMADSMTLPSTPTKNFNCTVPSSSKRFEALGYSGFSQPDALITAAVRTGGAGGAVGAGGAGGAFICTGKGEGGATG